MRQRGGGAPLLRPGNRTILPQCQRGKLTLAACLALSAAVATLPLPSRSAEPPENQIGSSGGMELYQIPRSPTVLLPVQIVLSCGSFPVGEAARTARFEIRPVSRKIRALAPERYENIPAENGEARIVHNYRIAGDYEIAASCASGPGSTRRVSGAVVVKGADALSFTGEGVIKTAGFIAVLFLALLLMRRMNRRTEKESR